MTISVDKYLCISGGGPAITYLAGGVSKAVSARRILGYAGTSAGAILATAFAFGIPQTQIKKSLRKMLDGRMINASVDSFARGGVIDWEILGREIDDMLGPNARIGDSPLPLVICATDLDRRAPLYLSKQKHPRVRVREALLASSAFMCGVTPSARIQSLGTDLSPDIRLFADGGFTDNTCDHVFDGKQFPRLLVRLKPDDGVVRVRPGDVIGVHRAVILSMLHAPNLLKSRRNDGAIMNVNGHNDWSFKKDELQIDAEWSIGYNSEIIEAETWNTTN